MKLYKSNFTGEYFLLKDDIVNMLFYGKWFKTSLSRGYLLRNQRAFTLIGTNVNFK